MDIYIIGPDTGIADVDTICAFLKFWLDTADMLGRSTPTGPVECSLVSLQRFCKGMEGKTWYPSTQVADRPLENG